MNRLFLLLLTLFSLATSATGRRDYYETLGVLRNANAAEIRTAYRRLAMKHHPDRHGPAGTKEYQDAEENFKEVKEAYDVLSDGTKRGEYDQRQSAATDGQSGRSRREPPTEATPNFNQTPDYSYAGVRAAQEIRRYSAYDIETMIRMGLASLEQDLIFSRFDGDVLSNQKMNILADMITRLAHLPGTSDRETEAILKTSFAYMQKMATLAPHIYDYFRIYGYNYISSKYNSLEAHPTFENYAYRVMLVSVLNYAQRTHSAVQPMTQNCQTIMATFTDEYGRVQQIPIRVDIKFSFGR